ncbi:MAG: hypothetical protein ACLVCW_04965 [Campylobacter sp.]
MSRQRGMILQVMDFADCGFSSYTAAGNLLSAALARCHPILEHIKRFEILFIKS